MQLVQELAFRRTSPMTDPRNVALVVGAQGVIGRNLVEHLETLDGWEVIGLSRRGGQSSGRVRHELVAPNVAMLANVLDALEGAPCLRHVSLIQGYKVYGAHSGPFKTPARESD